MAVLQGVCVAWCIPAAGRHGQIEARVARDLRIDKSSVRTYLIRAMRKLGRGMPECTAAAAWLLPGRAAAARLPDARGRGAGKVTSREIAVLHYVSYGMEDALIARDLGIGVETVRAYIISAMRNLRAGTREHAVATAMRQRLFP
jgi:DNA-binding NarL/FixJ family response regulator